MVKAYVLDQSAIECMANRGFKLRWADALFRDQNPELRKIEREEFYFLLGPNANVDSRILVICADGNGIEKLPFEQFPEAFERTLTVALATLNNMISINKSWKPYNNGNLISFQSNSRTTGQRARIILDRSPLGTNHLFACEVDDAHRDLNLYRPEVIVFKEAVAAYLRALPVYDAEQIASANSDSSQFDLHSRMQDSSSSGWNLDEWLRRLSKTQLDFVNCGLDHSIKLRGGPGTGKTAALLVKLALTIRRAAEQKKHLRIAFITPNIAASNSISEMLERIDAASAQDQQHVDLVITTLHQLATKYLRYSQDNLTPISLDADEGRRLQYEIVSDAVEEYEHAAWITRRNRCSTLIKNGFNADLDSATRRSFIYDIMNEFGSVLDAAGAGSPEEKYSKYLKDRRAAWMMNLETLDDRYVLLDLYKIYNRMLGELSTVSIDQMISDFIGYLDQFRWAALRKSEGFDIIFVDELHFFNKQDRSALHLLTRDGAKDPVVVMAYDPKQSPRDIFLPTNDDEKSGPDLWRNVKLGEIKKFELLDVFRYTPEILDLVSFIDSTFPAADLGSDWETYASRSLLPSGRHPTVTVHETDLELYKNVFARAERRAHSLKRGRSVAVLSLSDDMFSLYANAGTTNDLAVVISRRDSISDISRSGRKFIFSRPEYVAGLQFDTVFVINCDRLDEILMGNNVFGRRRFASTVYLAVSRGERIVEIHNSLERGGSAELIDAAVKRGVLKATDAKDLPSKLD